MDNTVCWVAMQSVFGYGSSRAIEVLQYFDDLNDFFKADENEVKAMHLLTPAELVRLKKVDFKEAESIVSYCEQKGYKILTPQSEDYPKRLLRIKNPPSALYVSGNLPNIDDEVAIAMVGTRGCTKNGLIVGSVLSYRLAEAGAIIISGGAVGIDTACSRGAVAAKKPSVIVLGCGLDYPYLLNNRKIRDDVAANGAVISEFPPKASPSKTTFPIRNRIMSALSLGVVLIEAPEKSGALITVSAALEQGKDVFVLPGDITNKN
ncbi:MAG: DNA-processing protein DprA, partial [Acutalibacteraceae bacterium]|nr:DNA-processing protein DprA [Acutalibacteraceae bacterium]